MMCHVERSETSLAYCDEFNLENDPRSFASLRMTLWGWLVSRCRAYRALSCSHSVDEIFECAMIFDAGRGLNAAANVNATGRHRCNRSSDVLRGQPARQNQKPRVA